jgi:hypothetical protein
MPKHKVNRVIYIDARSRIKTGSGSNFTVEIVNRDPFIGTMVIKEINIPFSFYQINSSNNQLDFTESVGGAFTATLPPGNYTAASLPLAIKAALDFSSSTPVTYTVTLNTSTLKLFITPSSGAISMEWATGPNSANSAHLILGFPKLDVPLALTVDSPNTINTQPENYIFLRSNAIKNIESAPVANVIADNDVDDDSAVIAKIPIQGEFGDILHYEEFQVLTRRFPVNTTKLGMLDFRLTFYQDNPIDLNGNDRVSLTLLLMEEKSKNRRIKRIGVDPRFAVDI